MAKTISDCAAAVRLHHDSQEVGRAVATLTKASNEKKKFDIEIFVKGDGGDRLTIRIGDDLKAQTIAAAWKDTPNSHEAWLTNGLWVRRAPSVSVSHAVGIKPGPLSYLTRSDVMKDLIAKLKQATEGSRELDGKIACAVGHAKSVVVEGMKDIVFYPPYRDGTLRCNPSRYTTSLDAALTLVPERWWWGAQNFCGPHKSDTACFLWKLWTCENPPVESAPKSVIGMGPSPALALCIAALKARQA